MKLHSVSITIADDCIGDKEFEYVFSFRREFVTDYLSRKVRPLKIETGGCFTMITQKLVKDVKQPRIADYLRVLITNHLFTPEMKEELVCQMGTPGEYEYYLSLLEDSYRQAATIMPIPVNTLLHLHDEFRQVGYKNEWLLWSRNIKEFNIAIELKCFFTTVDFRLEVEAFDYRKTHRIAKGIILQTPPDRICFDKDIRKVRINGDKVEILDFLGFPKTDLNLKDLADGKVTIQHHDKPYLVGESWYKTIEETLRSSQNVIRRLKTFGNTK